MNMKKIMLGVVAVAVAFSMYGTTALAAQAPRKAVRRNPVSTNSTYGYNDNGYNDNYGYGGRYRGGYGGRYWGGCCGHRGWY